MIKREERFFHYLPQFGEYMLANLRRLKRKDIALPATVTAWRRTGSTPLNASFSCQITNISKNGACLFLDKVMEGSFHIFYSTREDEGISLRLNITVPPEDKLFTFTAHPVWFDLFEDEQRREFKLGIEFPPLQEEEQVEGLQSILAL